MSIEVLAVPILVKAVDFLFDQAKETLAERRDARQKEHSQINPPLEIPLLDKDKESVLNRRVSEEMVRLKQKEVESTLVEIAAYQKNLQRLREQIAAAGGPKNAPIDKLSLRDAQEESVLEASARLAKIIDSITTNRT